MSGDLAGRARSVWPTRSGVRRGAGGAPTGRDAPGRLVVELPGALPGWLVRVLPPLLVLAVGATVASESLAWVVVLALAALATWRPSGLVPVVLTAVLAVRLLPLARPGLVLLAGLVLGVHLVAASCGLARHVAWAGLVDPAALGRLAADLVPVQVVSQALVLVAALLVRGADVPAGSLTSLVLRAVAVVALAGVLHAVSPRRRR